jgi:hypothetical protein
MIARSVVTILTALFLGATLVYLLAPSPLQLAAMKAREGQYDEARAAYEELLAQRGRTRAIVLPLADIYVGAGEDELARELLRAYVQGNPGDSAVAQRFADLLGDNQFVDKRIHVLRMIAENTDDVSVWRELEMLYDLRNLPDERTEALWEIAQGGDATLDKFNELARLLAARNDRERALAVSLRALRSRPDSITLDGAEFHVALALALDRGDLADEAIEAWNGAHEIPGDTLTFANILENMGAPDLALRLIEQSTGYEEGNTVLRLNASRLRAAAGDPTAAFDQLLAWQAQGNLPAAGYALITELGATLGRSDEVLAALATVRLSSLPLNTQLAAVELGTVQVNNELLEAWRAEAGEDWRGLPPLTGANLAFGLGDTENGANLATRALEEAVTDADRANAARALASVGLTQQAGETITALNNEQAQNTLDADALGPLAEAALTLGRSNTALSAAEPLANSSAAPYDQALHARALSAAGRPREALDILDRLNTGDPAVEPSLMAALLGAGERERLQALVYQRLADPNLSRQRRNDLLNLLVDSAPLRAGAEELSSGIAAELRNGGLCSRTA